MDDNKKLMIDKLISLLQHEGEILKEESIDPISALERLDVLIDSMKFLENYEENCKVLNQYWINKNYQNKFKYQEEREK